MPGLTTDPAADERVARFRSDFERALGRPVANHEPIALAVSGGPDSMAMLALAAAAFPGQAIAATVDHRLRADSAQEAAMVGDWCAGSAIAHAVFRIPTAPLKGDNLQAWARQERYRLLRRWAVECGAAILATAHHVDDQAETFLMRAARGSGLAGLAAIRACQQVTFAMSVEQIATEDGGLGLALDNASLTLLRPLLGWRRAELRALAQELALPFVDDPSNADDRFDRTRFRAWLAAAPWLDPVKIGRSAHYLAETDSDLRALERWLWQARAVPGSPYEERLDVADLPREVRRRLVRIAIEAVRVTNGIMLPEWSHAANVEPLLDALEAGKGATQGGVMASAEGTIWQFREAPPRRSH